MKVNGKHYRTIWLKEDDSAVVQIIDQRWLPHQFVVEDLKSVEDLARAIEEMHLRGAPLIGSAAAYGMYLATLQAPPDRTFDKFLNRSAVQLKATRPTAVNLAYALDRVLNALEKGNTKQEKIALALKIAEAITEESVAHCRKIGEFGFEIIEKISSQKKGETVNILTHCNAGWLACIDFGTATAPIYAAFEAGVNIHVWVDETRPRNQGARLTAFELGEQGIPHTIITDNAGGHLMQRGMVDLVLVGSDRTTLRGDVGNKIGTYLKALAAFDNGVPFYAALPSSSFDWTIRDGLKEIPIEQRGAEEVKYIQGNRKGKLQKVLLTPKQSPAANYAFDVTPARLVTGLITERGICAAKEEGIAELFPDLLAV